MRLLATMGAFLFSGIVAATSLHDLVVFGDSLSDNGNLYEVMKHQLPQSPPYYEGRFSNGPVWVENLIASYYPKDPNEHMLNYAFGGAGVSEEDDDDGLFTLRKEVTTYLLSHHDKASPDSLYVVWIGANNYLALPEDLEQTLKNVNNGIVHSLEKLVDKGAKHILILNLPDLGKTPAAKEFNAVESMGYLAHQHNDILNKSITELKNTHPDVNWLFFDLGILFDSLMANPDEFGFTNVSGTCSQSTLNTSLKPSLLGMVSQVKPHLNDACDGYLFFDLVHPTKLAHEQIARSVRAMLEEKGIELN